MMEQVIYLADTVILILVLLCEDQQLLYNTHCTAHRVNLVAQYVNESKPIISILSIDN